MTLDRAFSPDEVELVSVWRRMKDLIVEGRASKFSCLQVYLDGSGHIEMTYRDHDDMVTVRYAHVQQGDVVPLQHPDVVARPAKRSVRSSADPQEDLHRLMILRPHIDRILDELGASGAPFTADARVWDFLGPFQNITDTHDDRRHSSLFCEKVSDVLGVPIRPIDRILDVAWRLHQQKHLTPPKGDAP